MVLNMVLLPSSIISCVNHESLSGCMNFSIYYEMAKGDFKTISFSYLSYFKGSL